MICLGLLIYLHVVFNQKPGTCLSHLQKSWPRQGILRVELFFEPAPEGYNLQQSYAKEFVNSDRNHSFEQEISSLNLTINSSSFSSLINEENQTNKTAQIIEEQSLSHLLDDPSLFEIIFDFIFNYDWIKQFLIEEYHILEYSLEYGFLRLRPETRQRLNIEVLLVPLGKSIIS